MKLQTYLALRNVKLMHKLELKIAKGNFLFGFLGVFLGTLQKSTPKKFIK